MPFFLKKMLKTILLISSLVLAAAIFYFCVGFKRPAAKIDWGVVFSQKHAELLGLDWRQNYLALLNDLKVRNFKLVVYWDMIEKNPDEYNFDDLDWQINEAAENGAKILLVVGRKVPRWPECHMPEWVKSLSETDQKERVLKFVGQVISRYRDNPAIWAWQIENEPFFPFGQCPAPDKKLLQKEIQLVKSLDIQKRPIVVTESGEFSPWTRAARLGDMVGTTMYRKVWFHQLKSYVSYPFPPVFYHRKALLVEKFFHKKVICVELQAEPWGPVLLYDLSLEEQQKTMTPEKLKATTEYARQTGLDTFYLWGAEWWYWMKEKQSDSSFWQEAKKLFD